MSGDVLTQAVATALLVILSASIINAIAEAFLMMYVIFLPLLFVLAVQVRKMGVCGYSIDFNIYLSPRF